MAVVGAGVVGAAVAQTLAAQGLQTVVLEQHPRAAEETTSRNSGVLHAGLYYPPGSLKATLCVEGNQRTRAWCRERGVPFAQVGKLVVAVTEAELEALDALWSNAQACGAQGLERWTAAAASAEVGARLAGAFFSAHTAVVDAVALTESLLADAERHGATRVCAARVEGLSWDGGAARLSTTRGELRAGWVVNAAGLYADEVAAMAGVGGYRIWPCRGDYFFLRAARAFRHLVYPVQPKDATGLGVHLTLGLDGSVRLGPDAEYVASKRDFSPREEKREAFLQAAERYLGPLPPEALRYDLAGLRPKLRAPGEPRERDFVVERDLPWLINLVGIESPGLTAALALAHKVAALMR